MNTDKEPEWRLEYRCRRCGAIDRATGTTRDDAHVLLVELTATATGFPGRPRHQGVHACLDGGLGMADLIGARPAVSTHLDWRVHIRDSAHRTLCGATIVPEMRMAPLGGCDEGATCGECLAKF